MELIYRVEVVDTGSGWKFLRSPSKVKTYGLPLRTVVGEVRSLCRVGPTEDK